MALHLRGPETDVRSLLKLARELMPHAVEAGALLAINDRVDVALAVGAGAVHLGGRSLPPDSVRRIVGRDRLVGASVHSVEEAMEARDGGADYLFVGTIYPSDSHPTVDPAGPGLLEEVSRAVNLPLLAIGGMEPERVAEVTAAGGSGVAALSAIWDAQDPGGAVAAFLDVLSVSSGSGAGETGGGE